jgi:hypothetical protein
MKRLEPYLENYIARRDLIWFGILWKRWKLRRDFELKLRRDSALKLRHGFALKL